MSLYLDYRPTSLDEIIGNGALVSAIKGMFKTNKVPHAILLQGPTGCVDCDTEFLSPDGWVKICDWKKGMQVMQYNDDGTGEFVNPIHYIKNKARYLYHLKTKYGIDQCLSAKHRFAYFLPHKNKKIYTKKFSEIMLQHEASKNGFTGKVQTIFTPVKQKGVDFSEIELRLQVMFIADGSLMNDNARCCLNLKKQRKINRARKLLKESGIHFTETSQANGYVRFYYTPPICDKTFPKSFYTATSEQLYTICEESLYWDAWYKHWRVSSTNKENIDFLQFAFASSGLRTTVYSDARENKNSTCYELLGTDRTLISFVNPHEKVKINKYETLDGYEYCFTVPSSYLVLRRNNKIFITGNCGKTTIARIIANMLGCEENDLVELDSAQFRGIDTVRDIRRNCQFTPISGSVKVYIIDEVHKMTGDAQNAFLKILEDTPEHVYFILCTTDPQKLISAVKGRCSTFQVNKLNRDEMYVLLNNISASEGKKISEEICDLIYSESDGHARNALQILEQVLAVPKSQRLEIAKKVALEHNEGIDLARALSKRAGWVTVKGILAGLKEKEPESVRRIVVGYATSVLLNGENDNAALILEAFGTPFYDTGFPQLVMACYIVNKG